MREPEFDAPYSQNEPPSWAGRCGSAVLRALRVLAFALLAVLEPLARLSVVLALICAGSAGLFTLTGPKNAPVTELLVGAGVLMLLPVLYYLLMRGLRPDGPHPDGSHRSSHE